MARLPEAVTHRINCWKGFKPPTKPSKLNMEIFESFIFKVKNKKNPKIMVLGSTPELRDLIIKNGLKPTCVDISKDVYEALTYLMKEKGEEEFIHADWTKMSTNSKYDLIIGDSAINMLRWRDFGKYLEKVSKLLKPDGIYVERIPVRSTFEDEKTFLSRLGLVRKLAKKLKKELVWLLYYDIMLFTYPRNKEEMNFKRDFGKLKRLVNSGLMTKDEFEAIDKFAAPYRFCMPEKSKFESLAEKFLSITHTIDCNDPESHGYSLVYVMSKR